MPEAPALPLGLPAAQFNLKYRHWGFRDTFQPFDRFAEPAPHRDSVQTAGETIARIRGDVPTVLVDAALLARLNGLCDFALARSLRTGVPVTLGAYAAEIDRLRAQAAFLRLPEFRAAFQAGFDVLSTFLKSKTPEELKGHRAAVLAATGAEIFQNSIAIADDVAAVEFKRACAAASFRDRTVEVHVEDPMGEGITVEQRRAYDSLRQNLDATSSRVLNAILAKAHAEPEWIAAYELYEDKGPLILNSLGDLEPHIALTGVYVHDMSRPGARAPSIGFGFECSWDQDHGLGVRFRDDEIIVGGEDDAFCDYYA